MAASTTKERAFWAVLSALLAFKSVDLTIEKDKVEIKLQRAEAAQEENNFGLASVAECMEK
jgi:hypothetical protein